MSNFFNITKSVVSGIWNTGVTVYNIAEESATKIIDEQTEAELKKSGYDSISKTNYRYIQKRKEIKKEMQTIGLKGGAIALGAGLFI